MAVNGRPEEIGDGTLRRTRENVRAWLLDWNGVETNAHRRLPWTRLKAEIEIAVASLPGEAADYFDLSCVWGYTDDEICAMARVNGAPVTRRQCESYWHCLLSGITCRVCDNRIYEQPPTGRGPYPTGWVGGKVEWWERS